MYCVIIMKLMQKHLKKLEFPQHFCSKQNSNSRQRTHMWDKNGILNWYRSAIIYFGTKLSILIGTECTCVHLGKYEEISMWD